MEVVVVANPLPARPASPPFKRRAGALVSVLALRRATPKQKPRQSAAGLSLRGLSKGACRRFQRAKHQRQTRQLNAADASSVARREGDSRMKKPRRSGARFHRRGLPLATTTNPRMQ